MGRETCQMVTLFNGEFYCDYRDFGFTKCHEMLKCPDNLDEDWEEEDDDDNDFV